LLRLSADPVIWAKGRTASVKQSTNPISLLLLLLLLAVR
jgi:hypothetical protein